ncbi:hypothetical protein AcV7_005756 [Taiwanofungus camphoratus]|nr:hypothetical protein AcW2_007155 [Antrodia cinnamomea]KAI0923169.1 hypothetical protein AcV7_005756 [Antrodia cinnamomea]
MSASPRSSTSSFSSGRQSPIDGFDSSAALILVPDTEDTAGSTPFELTSDDDTDDEANGQAERVQASTVPPLPSTTVFLYLLAPFLRLGALLVPDGGLPLRVSVPALLFFAGLSALTRQIWYMLARYVRRADLEEIVLETFARERGRDSEGRRWFLRQVVRTCSGVFRILLAATYLRASVDVLLPLLPEKLLLPSRILTTLVLALAISPISLPPSLAAGRVIYATWISIATYAAWFGCTAYSHAKGTLAVNTSSTSLGSLWQPIATMAFAFGTSSTVPLYASLRGTVQPDNLKPKRSQSFKLLSVLSVGVAIVCILPLLFFQSSQAPPETPSTTVRWLMASFNAATLMLSIPSILITTPSLPVPFSIRRSTNLPVSKILIYFITICLSLPPPSVSSAFSDLLIMMAFLSTYMLPAFIHIILHNFRRPLSIIIPPSTPVTSSSSAHTVDASDSRHDELLQRKERTLQRRRLGRRIVWDIGAWVLLVPVGGGGLVWAGGRLAGRW